MTTWQNLQKSGVDPETIEQAIARLITVHNNDGIAHTTVGQSIDEHRKNGILDHPQGCVLGDKYSNKDFIYSPMFESPNIYTRSGAGINYSAGAFLLSTGTILNTARFLRAGAQYSARDYKPTIDTTFQFNFQTGQAGNYIAYGVTGANGLLEVGCGIGFKFVNGGVRAVQIITNVIGDPIETEFTIVGLSATIKRIYRVELSVSDNLIRWYADSTLVHSAVIQATFDVPLSLFEFYVRNTNTVQTTCLVSNIYVSLAVINT